MCISPITIENPNFRQGKLGYNRIHNTIDKYIQVPCGHCRQCIATKQSYFLQKYDVELMDNELFFFTLTYKVLLHTINFMGGGNDSPSCFVFTSV